MAIKKTRVSLMRACYRPKIRGTVALRSGRKKRSCLLTAALLRVCEV